MHLNSLVEVWLISAHILSTSDRDFGPEKLGPGDQYSTKLWSPRLKFFVEFQSCCGI